jgi:hypothetical protein
MQNRNESNQDKQKPQQKITKTTATNKLGITQCRRKIRKVKNANETEINKTENSNHDTISRVS